VVGQSARVLVAEGGQHSPRPVVVVRGDEPGGEVTEEFWVVEPVELPVVKLKFGRVHVVPSVALPRA
jgi:hypothetical protein